MDSLCQEFIKGGMWKNYSGTILCHGEALREHTRASPVQENCYKELPPGNRLAMCRGGLRGALHPLGGALHP